MNHSKSTIFSNSTDAEKVGQTSAVSKSVVTTIETLSNIIDNENYLLIWIDANIDESNEDYRQSLTQLHDIINNIEVFTQLEKCIQFINEINDTKIFLIVSTSLGQQLVQDIHAKPQLDAIYILADNNSSNEEWIKEWNKIQGIYTSITSICQALQLVVKQCDRDSMPISFLPPNEMNSIENLNQLESNFMYSQIFKEILLDMEYNEQCMKDLTGYWRRLYPDSRVKLSLIDQFERNYSPQSAISWYTRDCFIYRMLNQALRKLEGEKIINMGFFLRDIHQQIQQLHQKQISDYKGQPFIVYRGQGLTKVDFEKLLKTKDGLISFNNFLSTTREANTSIPFANGALINTDTIAILFKILIDPSITSVPFASIQDVSYFEEEEILFSMHTVFRVGEIKPSDDEISLYQVDLRLTADDDEQLRILMKYISEEVGDDSGWRRLGTLLCKIGQVQKAEELYKTLLEQTSNENDKGYYYNQLGCIKQDQSDYNNAIEYHKKVLEIYEKILPDDHPSLSTFYNNLGVAYKNIAKYSEALLFLEKALEIRKKTLPSKDPNLATSYNNIGGVYYQKGEYLKAVLFFEKDLDILEKTLPMNHPNLATSYNNIGEVYRNIAQYSKARLFYEKALEIRKKALPVNHPDLAASYNNIGGIYDHIGEYSKALSCYEKTCEIFEEILLENHPSLATSYSNIGMVHLNMGEYLKAHSFYEKAFKIQEKIYPKNHPSLATSYNNIGIVYQRMGEYSKAFLSYEKALEIYQEILPADHPSFAIYINIGLVYHNLAEYSKALLSYEKGLEIQQKTLSTNHPDLAQSYNNIAGVYMDLQDYLKALSFFEKSLEILENTLPAYHPDLATSYNNIGLFYDSMKEYAQALSFYEKGLEINKRTLPVYHPSLATSYNNIGAVFYQMEEYSKALSFYEKDLEIIEKILPENHPDLATSCNNIATAYYKIGDYQRALSYFERALDIRQHSLPPNHPSIDNVKESIEVVKMKNID